MSDAYEMLLTVVRPLIAKAGAPTPENIRATINQFRVIPTFSVSDDDAERLAKEIESQLDIHMTLGSAVQDETVTEWYEHVSESIEELRDELRRMEQAKMTPAQFGLRVPPTHVFFLIRHTRIETSVGFFTGTLRAKTTRF